MTSKPPDANVDETPTPRLTQEWKSNSDRARELAEQCRAKARAVSMARPGGEMDVARANALGDLAGLCDHYRRRFDDWALTAIPYPQKERELRAFESVAEAAAAELELPRAPRRSIFTRT